MMDVVIVKKFFIFENIFIDIKKILIQHCRKMKLQIVGFQFLTKVLYKRVIQTSPQLL
jgi:hypothetical protein